MENTIILPRRGDAPTSTTNVGETERLLSLVGGGALVLFGLTGKGGLGKLLLPLAGGMLVYRGLTGYCSTYSALGLNTATPEGSATAVPAGHGFKVEESITIDRPAGQLYSFWRKFDQLPRIMSHLKSVKVLDNVRSHWVAEGPLGVSVAWDAEIINDRPNELIAWKSQAGATVDTAGSVHFVPRGRGTEIRVSLKYDPPGGKAGAWAAWLAGSDPQGQIREDLRNFQRLMESSESPAEARQFAGRY